MKSEDGWACQLGTTADPSKLEQFKPFLLERTPKMQDDKVVTATSTPKEFSIVTNIPNTALGKPDRVKAQLLFTDKQR